ncbi:MAG: cupin-like domain-containing protein, partial [Pseudomonadota bacterium]|nr:cupin-like domain-containing protein [Pseudomonadota bacterium]
MATTGPVRITEEAQRWIAENLLLGATPELIVGRLLQRGCPPALAKAEVDLAAASPYLQGVGVLKQRLAKRDWLLASYSKLARSDAGASTIPVIDTLPADDFFRDYYAAHRPVIIAGLAGDWPAMARWSLDYFEATLGDPEIEVQTGREANAAYEQDSIRHKQLMPLSQVLAMLRAPGETNDFYVTANNSGHNRAALARLWDDVGPI